MNKDEGKIGNNKKEKRNKEKNINKKKYYDD